MRDGQETAASLLAWREYYRKQRRVGRAGILKGKEINGYPYREMESIARRVWVACCFENERDVARSAHGKLGGMARPVAAVGRRKIVIV